MYNITDKRKLLADLEMSTISDTAAPITTFQLFNCKHSFFNVNSATAGWEIQPFKYAKKIPWPNCQTDCAVEHFTALKVFDLEYSTIR